jgi:NDP-sugar pyrophosphorylase family protein
MIDAIIHAGGESTRLRMIFNGPKPLAPIGDKTLLWFHLQPLVNSGIVSNYIFTLRYKNDLIKEYLNNLNQELNISVSFIVESRPLGRAGSVRLGIEEGIIDVEKPYLMSHPDDLVPLNVKKLLEYAYEAERKGKILTLVMAERARNPFGIGIVEQVNGVTELKNFKEKPELKLIDGFLANTGVAIYMPEAMKEFLNVPLNKVTNPEDEIIPRLMKQNKVAVYVIERWFPVNYPADYKEILRIGPEKLLQILNST